MNGTVANRGNSFSLGFSTYSNKEDQEEKDGSPGDTKQSYDVALWWKNAQNNSSYIPRTVVASQNVP